MPYNCDKILTFIQPLVAKPVTRTRITITYKSFIKIGTFPIWTFIYMYVDFVFWITNTEEGGTLMQDRLHEIRPEAKMPGSPAELEKMIRGCFRIQYGS